MPWFAFENFAERNACTEARVNGTCCYVNDNGSGMAVRQYWADSWLKLADPVPSAPAAPNAPGEPVDPPDPIKPPPPYIPVKPPLQSSLFLNPCNKFSAHHRPIGTGAVPGPRSAMGPIKRVRCGSSKQGRKYIVEAKDSDPFRLIVAETGAPVGSKLPISIRMPSAGYPSTDGDDVVIIVPAHAKPNSLINLFFNFDEAKGVAKRRFEYPAGGVDFADGKDGYDRGSSGSGCRFPGLVLRGFEINSRTPAPIYHSLNFTATRHSSQGAPRTAHILGKRKVWPAYYMDSTADQAGTNMGELPYGACLYIPYAKLDMRDKLGLSERGKVMFDLMVHYGAYVIDGQGQHEDGGGILQLRLDQEVSNEAVDDLDVQLQKFLPHLEWIGNPRSLDAETEISKNGLPYAGGGNPLGAGSVNTAWDCYD